MNARQMDEFLHKLDKRQELERGSQIRSLSEQLKVLQSQQDREQERLAKEYERLVDPPVRIVFRRPLPLDPFFVDDFFSPWLGSPGRATQARRRSLLTLCN